MEGRSRFAVILGVSVALVAGVSQPAFAVKEFFDEFKAVYVKPDSSDANEKALAAEVETAKCNVCHVGSSKKDRNAYGQALTEKLDKNDKDAAKIKKALEEVAKLPSDPAKADSQTFGALLKAGKLPAK